MSKFGALLGAFLALSAARASAADSTITIQ